MASRRSSTSYVDYSVNAHQMRYESSSDDDDDEDEHRLQIDLSSAEDDASGHESHDNVPTTTSESHSDPWKTDPLQSLQKLVRSPFVSEQISSTADVDSSQGCDSASAASLNSFLSLQLESSSSSELSCTLSLKPGSTTPSLPLYHVLPQLTPGPGAQDLNFSSSSPLPPPPPPPVPPQNDEEDEDDDDSRNIDSSTIHRVLRKLNSAAADEINLRTLRELPREEATSFYRFREMLSKHPQFDALPNLTPMAPPGSAYPAQNLVALVSKDVVQSRSCSGNSNSSSISISAANERVYPFSAIRHPPALTVIPRLDATAVAPRRSNCRRSPPPMVPISSFRNSSKPSLLEADSVIDRLKRLGTDVAVEPKSPPYFHFDDEDEDDDDEPYYPISVDCVLSTEPLPVVTKVDKSVLPSLMPIPNENARSITINRVQPPPPSLIPINCAPITVPRFVPILPRVPPLTWNVTTPSCTSVAGPTSSSVVIKGSTVLAAEQTYSAVPTIPAGSVADATVTTTASTAAFTAAFASFSLKKPKRSKPSNKSQISKLANSLVLPANAPRPFDFQKTADILAGGCGGEDVRSKTMVGEVEIIKLSPVDEQKFEPVFLQQPPPPPSLSSQPQLQLQAQPQPPLLPPPPSLPTPPPLVVQSSTDVVMRAAASAAAPPPPLPPLIAAPKTNFFTFPSEKAVLTSVLAKGRKLFVCTVCSMVYHKMFSLKKHFHRSHVNPYCLTRQDTLKYDVIVPPSKVASASSKNDAYKCDICLTLFNDIDTLSMHRVEHRPVNDEYANRFKCSRCTLVFRKEKVFTRHLQECRGSGGVVASAAAAAAAVPAAATPVAVAKTLLKSVPESCNESVAQPPVPTNEKKAIQKEEAVAGVAANATVAVISAPSAAASVVSTQHERVEFEDKTDDDAIGSANMMCLFCEVTFKDNTERQKHVLQVHHPKRKQQSCAYCKKKDINDLRELLQHICEAHNKKYFGCAKCKIRFKTKDELTAHRMESHPTDSLVATEKKTAVEKSTKSVAVVKGKNGRTFKCSKCLKLCSGMTELLRHRKTSHRPNKTKIKPNHYDMGDSLVTRAKYAPYSTDDYETEFYRNLSQDIKTNLELYLDGKLDGKNQTDSKCSSRSTSNYTDVEEKIPNELNFIDMYGEENFNAQFLRNASRLHIATQLIMLKKTNPHHQDIIAETQPSGSSVSVPCKLSLTPQKTNASIAEEGTSDDSAPKQCVFSGEWTRSRRYICAACLARFNGFWELDDHFWAKHPNVWHTYYQFPVDQDPGPEWLQTLKPHLSSVGIVAKADTRLTSLPPSSKCTKCGTIVTPLAEFHKHILECGGDTNWMSTIYTPTKKHKKWKPYSGRRRKSGPKNRMFVRNIPETPMKIPSQIRGKQKAGDSDSIQKMIANLPPKRITRRVVNFDDVERSHSRYLARTNILTRRRREQLDPKTSARIAQAFAVDSYELINNARRKRKEAKSKSSSPAKEEIVVPSSAAVSQLKNIIVKAETKLDVVEPETESRTSNSSSSDVDSLCKDAAAVKVEVITDEENHVTPEEVSVEASKAEMSIQASEAEVSVQASEAEVSVQAIETEKVATQSSEAEVSVKALETEVSAQVSEAEVVVETSKTIVSVQGSEAAMPVQTPAAEVFVEVPNTEVSVEVSNTEVSVEPPEIEASVEPCKIELSVELPKVEVPVESAATVVSAVESPSDLIPVESSSADVSVHVPSDDVQLEIPPIKTIVDIPKGKTVEEIIPLVGNIDENPSKDATVEKSAEKPTVKEASSPKECVDPSADVMSAENSVTSVLCDEVTNFVKSVPTDKVSETIEEDLSITPATLADRQSPALPDSAVILAAMRETLSQTDTVAPSTVFNASSKKRKRGGDGPKCKKCGHKKSKGQSSCSGCVAQQLHKKRPVADNFLQFVCERCGSDVFSASHEGNVCESCLQKSVVEMKKENSDDVIESTSSSAAESLPSSKHACPVCNSPSSDDAVCSNCVSVRSNTAANAASSNSTHSASTIQVTVESVTEVAPSLCHACSKASASATSELCDHCQPTTVDPKKENNSIATHFVETSSVVDKPPTVSASSSATQSDPQPSVPIQDEVAVDDETNCIHCGVETPDRNDCGKPACRMCHELWITLNTTNTHPIVTADDEERKCSDCGILTISEMDSRKLCDTCVTKKNLSNLMATDSVNRRRSSEVSVQVGDVGTNELYQKPPSMIPTMPIPCSNAFAVKTSDEVNKCVSMAASKHNVILICKGCYNLFNTVSSYKEHRSQCPFRNSDEEASKKPLLGFAKRNLKAGVEVLQMDSPGASFEVLDSSMLQTHNESGFSAVKTETSDLSGQSTGSDLDSSKHLKTKMATDKSMDESIDSVIRKYCTTSTPITEYDFDDTEEYDSDDKPIINYSAARAAANQSPAKKNIKKRVRSLPVDSPTRERNMKTVEREVVKLVQSQRSKKAVARKFLMFSAAGNSDAEMRDDHVDESKGASTSAALDTQGAWRKVGTSSVKSGTSGNNGGGSGGDVVDESVSDELPLAKKKVRPSKTTNPNAAAGKGRVPPQKSKNGQDVKEDSASKSLAATSAQNTSKESTKNPVKKAVKKRRAEDDVIEQSSEVRLASRLRRKSFVAEEVAGRVLRSMSKSDATADEAAEKSEAAVKSESAVDRRRSLPAERTKATKPPLPLESEAANNAVPIASASASAVTTADANDDSKPKSSKAAAKRKCEPDAATVANAKRIRCPKVDLGFHVTKTGRTMRQNLRAKGADEGDEADAPSSSTNVASTSGVTESARTGSAGSTIASSTSISEQPNFLELTPSVPSNSRAPVVGERRDSAEGCDARHVAADEESMVNCAYEQTNDEPDESQSDTFYLDVVLKALDRSFCFFGSIGNAVSELVRNPEVMASYNVSDSSQSEELNELRVYLDVTSKALSVLKNPDDKDKKADDGNAADNHDYASLILDIDGHPKLYCEVEIETKNSKEFILCKSSTGTTAKSTVPKSSTTVINGAKTAVRNGRVKPTTKSPPANGNKRKLRCNHCQTIVQSKNEMAAHIQEHFRRFVYSKKDNAKLLKKCIADKFDELLREKAISVFLKWSHLLPESRISEPLRTLSQSNLTKQNQIEIWKLVISMLVGIETDAVNMSQGTTSKVSATPVPALSIRCELTTSEKEMLTLSSSSNGGGELASMSVTHGGKNGDYFQCPVCLLTFDQKHRRNRHLVKAHAPQVSSQKMVFDAESAKSARSNVNVVESVVNSSANVAKKEVESTAKCNGSIVNAAVARKPVARIPHSKYEPPSLPPPLLPANIEMPPPSRSNGVAHQSPPALTIADVTPDNSPPILAPATASVTTASLPDSSVISNKSSSAATSASQEAPSNSATATTHQSAESATNGTTATVRNATPTSTSRRGSNRNRKKLSRKEIMTMPAHVIRQKAEEALKELTCTRFGRL